MAIGTQGPYYHPPRVCAWTRNPNGYMLRFPLYWQDMSILTTATQRDMNAHVTWTEAQIIMMTAEMTVINVAGYLIAWRMARN